MSIIKAENIKKSFMQADVLVEVLKGVTTKFESGKTYAISGASGSGKSTLLHLLAGLDTVNQGAIFFDGSDLATMNRTQRHVFLNEKIGLVFQLPYLIAELSVLENVMLKGLIKGMSRTQCEQQAHNILKKVGLQQYMHNHPLSLSGGQQQRIAIARALFNKPVFLMADEPTGNLDENTGITIMELLIECQQEWGMGVIVSSHDEYVTRTMQHKLHLSHGIVQEKV